jgi:aldehyde:ferredoxin oxidoreductase
MPTAAGPLGPETVLAFLSDLMTGGWEDASSGGNLSPALKACGYDGAFVSGRGQQPVSAQAVGKKVEIRPAGILWSWTP